MIKFNNLNQSIPYQLLKKKYDEAVDEGQKGVEAISISSYNKELNIVDSRFVNLKFIQMMSLFFLVIMNLQKHFF